MDPAAWNRVKDLVAEALLRPAAEREAFLEQRCESSTLRAEVRTLLRASDDMTTGFLEPVLPPPALDEGDLPLGSRIGPYLIVDSLGRGGMGQVFLGKDLRLHRQVALKSLLSSRYNSTDERARVLREARAAAQINHPNVATIHDIIEHDERAFIVMEYVPGESLAAVLRRERLPIDRVIALGRQIAAGLMAAHAKGVIHRDLKPANIQLTPEGGAKVLDFGVARTTAAFTTATGSGAAEEARGGPQPGTRGYMSPEQMLSRYVDERSDVFSLGILLFEMTTGERAFPLVGELDLLDAIHHPVRRADVVDPSVPRALADLVARALEIDPAARFQSAVAMAAALDALQQERTTKSTNGGTHQTDSGTSPWSAAKTVLVLMTWPLALVMLVALGYLTTAAFNVTLGRTAPFNQESPMVWFELGARSLVTPIISIGPMLLAVWTSAFAIRLFRLAPPIDRMAERVEHRCARLVTRLKLDEPGIFGQAVATAGVAALLVIIWFFGDLLRACATYTISDAPSSQLLPLQPGHLGALYRFALDAVILGLAAAMLRIRRLRAVHTGARPGTMAPIIALLALTVLLSETPYRLLWKNETERIDVGGQRCYVLGQQGDQALVYCPDQPPPRNQVITLSSPAVRRLGLPPESMFSPPASQ